VAPVTRLGDINRMAQQAVESRPALPPPPPDAPLSPPDKSLNQTPAETPRSKRRLGRQP
jgi:hypothetical protein